MPFVIGSSVSLSGVFGSIVTSSHHSSLSPEEMCVINSGAPSLNSTATCWVRYTSMCRLVVRLRRGRIATSPCMTSHDSGVMTPSACSRGMFITSFWNAQTDWVVAGPNAPSTGPGSKPRSTRRCWSRLTSSPYTPFDSVRVSGTFGALLAGAAVELTTVTTVSPTADVGTSSLTVAGALPALDVSSPEPPSTLAPITTAKTSAAMTAGVHCRRARGSTMRAPLRPPDWAPDGSKATNGGGKHPGVRSGHRRGADRLQVTTEGPHLLQDRDDDP